LEHVKFIVEIFYVNSSSILEKWISGIRCKMDAIYLFVLFKIKQISKKEIANVEWRKVNEKSMKSK